jgi:hypothetical protein
MAQESGIETPTAEDLARFDRKRKGKTLSNADWKSPTDPDARIAKMKDGTTHLAYKPEHAVDLDTGVVVAAPIHEGFRNARAGPSRQRQQYRPRPISLAPSRERANGQQCVALLVTRRHPRFARHAPPPRINAKIEESRSNHTCDSLVKLRESG